ncbi:hypothetical protein ACOCEA_10070 [Maribacter sp. CXY002]|uniref:hypothetical protein n=1 Tax=Maribacter luteocoastalis TaxID=3407671 RepID=UPI003B678D8E
MEDLTVLRANHRENKHFNVGDEVEYLIKGNNGLLTYGTVGKPSGSLHIPRFDIAPHERKAMIEHSIMCACVLADRLNTEPLKATVKRLARMVYEVNIELLDEIKT